MKKKYVIFDFDGTLVNTNEVIIQSWQAAARHYMGHEMDPRKIEETFGEALPFTVSYLMPEEDVMEVCDYHKAYQEKNCDNLVTMFDGMVELLDELKLRGYKLAVATSRRKVSFYEYMEKYDLLKYFDAEVVMEDVEHHKPHPESLLVALKKLGAKPEEAIMVGDTRFDIGCANNAGVDSVLVKYSHYIDFEELKRLGFEPTYTIEEPKDLLELI